MCLRTPLKMTGGTAKGEPQKQGLLVILSVSEVSTKLKRGFFATLKMTSGTAQAHAHAKQRQKAHFAIAQSTRRAAKGEPQKQGLLVILSVSEVSTNLKCGLHLKVWIFRYAQNDSEPSEQGKVRLKSERATKSQ